MKIVRFAAIILALSLAFGPKASFAEPDEYDDSQSHPLRVFAYLVYPAAFLLEWTVYRPFHFLVSATEPQEKLFGHTPHPPVLAEPQPVQSYGAPKKVLLPSQTQREQTPPPVATQP